jgi:hypothetical protein
MRDEFREAYSRLLEDRSVLSRRDFEYWDRTRLDAERYLTRVRNRVQRGIGSANIDYDLRPDTEYALIVCFEELIALPFFRGVSREEFQDLSEDFLQYVENDTGQVLRSAQAGKEGNLNEEEELTAGDVMRTISEVYDDLETVAVDVWG